MDEDTQTCIDEIKESMGWEALRYVALVTEEGGDPTAAPIDVRGTGYEITLRKREC